MEQVVLLDELGQAIGVEDKAVVHTRETPLHLAFSCYVFDTAGRLLVSQRALTKRTFPGVWTNSACGHPSPGEDMTDGVRRRVGDELGLALRDLQVVLPRFRYRAVMANGIVENEMCPVFRAFTDEQPAVDPAEVEATEWVDWSTFARDVLAGGRDVSPWCVEQVQELVELGSDPLGWTGDPARMPPAAPRSA